MGHQAVAEGSVERRQLTSDRDGGCRARGPHATDLGDIDNISPWAWPAETPTCRTAELQWVRG